MPPTTKVPSTTKKSRPAASRATARHALVSIAVPGPAAGETPAKLKKKTFGRLRTALLKAVRAAADEGLDVELDLDLLAAAAGRGAPPATTTGKAEPRRTAPPPERPVKPPVRSKKSAGARAAKPAAAPAPTPPAPAGTDAGPARAPRRTLRRTPARPPASPTT